MAPRGQGIVNGQRFFNFLLFSFYTNRPSIDSVVTWLRERVLKRRSVRDKIKKEQITVGNAVFTWLQESRESRQNGFLGQRIFWFFLAMFLFFGNFLFFHFARIANKAGEWCWVWWPKICALPLKPTLYLQNLLFTLKNFVMDLQCTFKTYFIPLKPSSKP